MRNPVRGLVAAGLLLTAAVTSSFNSARAEDCPSNADALGTSRVLIIDPNEYPHVGAMDHAAALPLSDKEVVITFERRTRPALHQPNSRHSRRSVREGDVLHCG
jgi:hypothetical protein